MKNELKTILSYISFSDSEIIFDGVVFKIESGDDEKEQRFVELLTEILYKYCYMVKFRRGIIDKVDNVPRLNSNEENFLLHLKNANKTRQGFDYGWAVENISHDGTVEVKKGNIKNFVKVGHYVLSNPNSPLQIGQFVNLIRRNELVDPNGSFYYVFSHQVVTNYDLVRVYWNIGNEGASMLIEKITESFNLYNIPFRFKCLLNPNFYFRRDSAVLYLEKQYFNVVSLIIKQWYSIVAPYLRNETPLFTKRIGQGVGFAEDPCNGQSFGMHRCRILAIALFNVLYKKVEGEVTIENIKSEFEKSGVTFGKAYLNSNRKYPYVYRLLS